MGLRCGQKAGRERRGEADGHFQRALNTGGGLQIWSCGQRGAVEGMKEGMARHHHMHCLLLGPSRALEVGKTTCSHPEKPPIVYGCLLLPPGLPCVAHSTPALAAQAISSSAVSCLVLVCQLLKPCSLWGT